MHPLDALCASLKEEFDSALASKAFAARATAGSELNEIVRRLRSYKGEAEWTSIILDGASLFCDRLALFAVTAGGLAMRGLRGLNLPPDLTFRDPLPRALDAVLRSSDAVIALRTPAEVGAALASPGANALAFPGAERALLLPILNEDRVVAVLAALGPDDAAVPGIELISVLAGTVLERRANTGQTIAIRPLPPPKAIAPASTGPILPPWARLTDTARTIHVRAQRFARVRVAEMQLAHADAVRAGRDQNNLYLFLKQPIDSARQKYQTQFMQPEQMREAAMLDYLHLELVRTMAAEDESRLGDEYPGPLE